MYQSPDITSIQILITRVAYLEERHLKMIDHSKNPIARELHLQESTIAIPMTGYTRMQFTFYWDKSLIQGWLTLHFTNAFVEK